MEIDVEKLKRDWAGFTFDTAEFEAVSEDLVGFAVACGETDKRYTDPNHPDFRAVPNYPSRYVGRRILPDDFPRLGGPLRPTGPLMASIIIKPPERDPPPKSSTIAPSAL